MMISRRRALLSTMAAGGTVGTSGVAFAQDASPTLGALTDIADALGMIRGVRREWRSINRIFYVASGRMRDAGGAVRPVSRAMIEMSFTQNASRVDATFGEGDGASRFVHVARGGLAWDEATPGVFSAIASGAAGRLWRNACVPQGAVRAALEAYVADSNSVSLSQAGPHRQVEVDTPHGRVAMLINPDQRPFRLSLKPADGAEIVTEVADYQDFEKLGVWFPAELRHASGGAVFEELAVSEYRSNPYVIFPIPEALRDAAPARSQQGGQHG